jgi:hypothetical protein
MVYQLNIQTIPLTRRSHLIVRFPVADTAAWFWSITGAVRRRNVLAVACMTEPAPLCGREVEEREQAEDEGEYRVTAAAIAPGATSRTDSRRAGATSRILLRAAATPDCAHLPRKDAGYAA